jgi:hypothetical protein
MRLAILYVSPDHLPDLPSWYPSQDAVFARRAREKKLVRSVPLLVDGCQFLGHPQNDISALSDFPTRNRQAELHDFILGCLNR